MSFVVAERRYGKYKGFVSNNNDPQKLGRIKVTVPSVYGKQESGEFLESPWALPSVPFAGEDEGMLCLPSVNSGVWVEFEEGDISRPIWVGCFWARPSAVTKVSTRTGSEVPGRENYPKNRVIETKLHRIEMNDATRELRIMSRVQDADITIKEDGTFNIENGHHQFVLGGANQGSLFRYDHKINEATIQVQQSGDMVLNTDGTQVHLAKATGDISIEHKSGTSIDVYQDAVEIETQDGSAISLGKADAKIELSTGQSIMMDNDGNVMELTAGNLLADADSVELSSGINQFPLVHGGFFVTYNALRALLAAHVHVCSAPGNPSGPSVTLAPLAVPEVAVPVVNVTAQVSGA